MEKLNYIDWKVAEANRIRKKAHKERKRLLYNEAKERTPEAREPEDWQSPRLKKLRAEKKARRKSKVMTEAPHYTKGKLSTNYLDKIAKLKAQVVKASTIQSKEDKVKREASLDAFKKTYVRKTELGTTVSISTPSRTKKDRSYDRDIIRTYEKLPEYIKDALSNGDIAAHRRGKKMARAYFKHKAAEERRIKHLNKYSKTRDTIRKYYINIGVWKDEEATFKQAA